MNEMLMQRLCEKENQLKMLKEICEKMKSDFEKMSAKYHEVCGDTKEEFVPNIENIAENETHTEDEVPAIEVIDCKVDI
jgi:pyruvate-formate lyase-activating enzyme